MCVPERRAASTFKNRLMNFNSAREAIEHGFAMITEEPKANRRILKCDLTYNTTIANLGQYKTAWPFPIQRW